jgi:hypothetical protein
MVMDKKIFKVFAKKAPLVYGQYCDPPGMVKIDPRGII